jgi:hypothetical protein
LKHRWAKIGSTDWQENAGQIGNEAQQADTGVGVLAVACLHACA